MKKFLKIGAGVIALVLVVAIVLPFLFKDEIKKAVNNEINKNVNAEVYFGDLGVTLFRNFPNITVGLDNFGVVGINEFEGDTLVDVESFRMVLDIMSVISGEEYQLREVALESASIHAKVLKNGKANWDIVKTDSTTLESDTAAVDTAPSTPINLQLHSYSLSNTNIVYNDMSSAMYLQVKNLNHSGSGDFEEDVFDFETETTADEVSFKMDGDNYLSKARIDADLNVNIDQANSKYTLRDNSIGINDFVLNLEGWLSLAKEDAYGMDLSFNTEQSQFKKVLSLVPGMYTEDFSNLETDGTFTFAGTAKGDYSERSLPEIHAELAVANGYFHYPDLPEAVSNINFDLKVDVPKGDINALKVNFPKFHAELGKNPIDAKMILSGLTSENINLDASVKAKLDLAEVSTMIPMEGQELKGNLDIDATAKGIYNETAGTFPTASIKLALENGYLKSADFPSALDKMSMQASISNPDGKMSSTLIEVPKFHTELDGEPIDMSLQARNLDDIEYKMSLKGSLDLEKLNKIYPLEDTEMSGTIQADITTSGKQSDIEAERYTKLPTSGTIGISKLSYKDADVPQGVKVKNGKATFTPSKLNIEQLEGHLGQSPVTVKGYLENYLAYALLDDEMIKGRMTLISSRFDVNEWMSADEEEGSSGGAPTKGEEEELSVYPIPKGIDFIFDATLAKVLYDNLVLKDLKGKIYMQNEEVRFENCSFKTLGGDFALKGAYNTRDINAPEYDIDFALQGLDVQKTYKTFSTVQALAPAAKFVNGTFNSMFNLKGKLGPDMMPDLSTLTSLGNMMVLNSKVKNLPILDKVAEKTKLNTFKTLDLDDTKIFFEVEDGRFKVEPFDVEAGKTTMKVSGSNGIDGIDGTLDYLMKLDIPAGAAGSSALSALSGLTGTNAVSTEKIEVDLGLGGTFTQPKITSIGGGTLGGVSDAVDDKIDEVKDEVEDKIDEKKEELKDQVDENLDKAKEELAKQKAEAERKAKEEAERLKREAEAKKKAEEERLRKEAEKAKKEAEKKAQEELDKLNPFKKDK